ncbi:Uncharacterized protein Adt_44062 [Abeliophyllum distichum]|uniref:Uncharacterized protein n=1 Tax=Abeliophyllum distichum TaxID=126358 RepID=A0ABD1PAE2_9LAMI
MFFFESAADCCGICLTSITCKDEQHPSFINFITSFLNANSFRLNFVPIAPDFIFNCGGLSVAFLFVINWDCNDISSILIRYYDAPSPSDKRLRSMSKIQSFLNEHPEYAGVTVSQFSFQTPAPMEENYVRKRRASSAASHEMSGTLMPDHLEDLHFGEGQNFVSDVEAEKLLKLEICNKIVMQIEEFGHDPKVNEDELWDEGLGVKQK